MQQEFFSGYNSNLNLATQIEEESILHRNKLTPYKGKKLQGKVVKTILKGKVIYNEGEFSEPMGEFLVPNLLEEKILEKIQFVVAPTAK